MNINRHGDIPSILNAGSPGSGEANQNLSVRILTPAQSPASGLMTGNASLPERAMERKFLQALNAYRASMGNASAFQGIYNTACNYLKSSPEDWLQSCVPAPDNIQSDDEVTVRKHLQDAISAYVGRSSNYHPDSRSKTLPRLIEAIVAYKKALPRNDPQIRHVTASMTPSGRASGSVAQTAQPEPTEVSEELDVHLAPIVGGRFFNRQSIEDTSSHQLDQMPASAALHNILTRIINPPTLLSRFHFRNTYAMPHRADIRLLKEHILSTQVNRNERDHAINTLGQIFSTLKIRDREAVLRIFERLLAPERVLPGASYHVPWHIRLAASNQIVSESARVDGLVAALSGYATLTPSELNALLEIALINYSDSRRVSTPLESAKLISAMLKTLSRRDNRGTPVINSELADRLVRIATQDIRLDSLAENPDFLDHETLRILDYLRDGLSTANHSRLTDLADLVEEFGLPPYDA